MFDDFAEPLCVRRPSASSRFPCAPLSPPTIPTFAQNTFDEIRKARFYPVNNLEVGHPQLHYIMSALSEQTLIAADRRGVSAFDLLSLASQPLFKADIVHSVDVDADAQRVLVSASHQTALLNCERGDAKALNLGFSAEALSRAIFFPSEREKAFLCGNMQNQIAFDLHRNSPFRSFASLNYTNSADFGERGLIAFAGDDPRIELFDARSAVRVAELSAHNAPNFCVQFCEANVLATASEDRSIRFWDLRTFSQINVFGLFTPFYALRFDAKRQTVIALSEVELVWIPLKTANAKTTQIGLFNYAFCLSPSLCNVFVSTANESLCGIHKFELSE